MSTWNLLRYLLPAFDPAGELPLVLREVLASRDTRLRALRSNALSGALFLLIITQVGAITLAPATVSSACLTFTVTLIALGAALAPSAAVWTLPLGIALAPVIVREREHRTWDMLRLTPRAIEDILLDKSRGALLSARKIWGWQLNVVGVAAVIVGMMAFFAAESRYGPAPGAAQYGLSGLWAGGCAGLFLADRAQLFALMTVGGLSASAVSRSTRAALVAGPLTTGAIWLADVGIAAACVSSAHWDAMSAAVNLFALVALGPLGSYLIALSPPVVALLMLATLGLREITVALLWRWTVRAAH